MLLKRLVNDLFAVLLAPQRRRVRQLQATVRYLEQELAEMDR